MRTSLQTGVAISGITEIVKSTTRLSGAFYAPGTGVLIPQEKYGKVKLLKGGIRMKKRTAAVILWVLLALLFTGCAAKQPQVQTETQPETTESRRPPMYDPSQAPKKSQVRTKKNPEWRTEADYKEDKKAYIKFTKNLHLGEVYVEREFIQDYSSDYTAYNGTWFRDQLTEEECCIYNCYLYAMENGFTGFTLYVQDNDRDFRHLREVVSLVSPFLEQNTNRLALGETEFRNATDHIGESIWFYVPQFSPDRWELKMEALEKCREIVGSIPAEYTTQEEKMEYLYRYVVDHVDYVMYESMEDEDYLYDAVCKGETVCDGYSNMLNLLFCLIGVESYEAMGINYPDLTQLSPEEQVLLVGHTWVVARIGDQFYNFDPTFEDTDEHPEDETLHYFGFSDELLAMNYLSCEQIRPQCTDISRDGSMGADIVISDQENNDEIRAAAIELDARMEEGITETTFLIHGMTTEKQIQGFMHRLIGKTQKLARRVTLEGNYFKNAALVTVHAEHR